MLRLISLQMYRQVVGGGAFSKGSKGIRVKMRPARPKRNEGVGRSPGRLLRAELQAPQKSKTMGHLGLWAGFCWAWDAMVATPEDSQGLPY